jgi:hypothetical protein
VSAASDSLFLHPAQLYPLRAAHLAESPHRSRNAMRFRAEGTHKPRPLRVRNIFHDHGPASLANAKQNLGRRPELRHNFCYRLCDWLRRTPRGRLARPRGASCRSPRSSCGCHKFALNYPPRRVQFFYFYGFRRSTIIRSLLRFLRVFAPRVGKPQGVCGWLPFTRPSPPPCG